MPALTCRNVAASLPLESHDNEGLYKAQIAIDEVVYTSAALRPGDPPFPVQIPIRGKQISFAVLAASDGPAGDRGVWLSPRLVRR